MRQICPHREVEEKKMRRRENPGTMPVVHDAREIAV
jgi:hypothetical protein